MTVRACVENVNGATLWECACAECTRLQWEARDDSGEYRRETLRDYRAREWPDHWADGPRDAALSNPADR